MRIIAQGLVVALALMVSFVLALLTVGGQLIEPTAPHLLVGFLLLLAVRQRTTTGFRCFPDALMLGIGMVLILSQFAILHLLHDYEQKSERGRCGFAMFTDLATVERGAAKIPDGGTRLAGPVARLYSRRKPYENGWIYPVVSRHHPLFSGRGGSADCKIWLYAPADAVRTADELSSELFVIPIYSTKLLHEVRRDGPTFAKYEPQAMGRAASGVIYLFLGLLLWLPNLRRQPLAGVAEGTQRVA